MEKDVLIMEEKVTMFPADYAGQLSGKNVLIRSVFNFNDFQDENRKTQAPVSAFLNIEIKKNQTFSFESSKNKCVVLVPIYNGFNIQDKQVLPGELIWIKDSSNQYQISTLDQNEDGIFLLIEIDTIAESLDFIAPTDIDIKQGQINEIQSPLENIQIALACFEKSKDTQEIFDIDLDRKHFFYTIQGSFDLNNRLVGKDDLIILENIKMLDIESLDNYAICLLITVNH